MKKFKIISIVAVIAIFMATLCSCKKTDNTAKVPQFQNAKFEEVFVADYEEKVTNEGKSSRLAQYEGYTMSSIGTSGYSLSNDDIVKMFTKTSQSTLESTGSTVTSEDYSLYNVILDREIATFKVEDTDAKSIAAVYCNYNNYVYAIKVIETTTLTGEQVATYYSLDGKKLVENSANVATQAVKYVSEERKDSDTYYVIEANDVNYEVNVKTGETESTEVKTVENVITDYELTYDVEGEKYNYIYGQYGEIYTYDKEGKLVHYQNFETDGSDATIKLLANETFLIQTSTYCDPYSDDYDLLNSSYGMQKSKIKQYIYNPSTNKKTQINPGFIVNSVDNKLVNEEFNKTYKDTVQNVATIAFVVDRNLVSRTRRVVINNDLKVVGYIDNYVVDQYIEPSLYADNRFIVVTGDRDGFYLNEKGEIIGKSISDATTNSRFILTSTALYDRVTFDKLLNLIDEGLAYSRTVGSNYIFTKSATGTLGSSTSYYTYGKTGLKMLFNSANVYKFSFSSKYYYVVEKITGSSSLTNTYKYSYFNGEGELMFSYEDTSAYSEISPITIYNIQLFACVTTDADGNNVYNYYRVA